MFSVSKLYSSAQVVASCDVVYDVRADGEYMEHSPGQIERHGEGTHYSKDGLIYSGRWENGKMNGEGSVTEFRCCTCMPYIMYRSGQDTLKNQHTSKSKLKCYLLP